MLVLERSVSESSVTWTVPVVLKVKEPKFTAPADPAAQWTGAQKGHAFFAYATNYLVDTDHAIIVDVETTRAIRQAEVGAARTMIDRTMDRFALTPSG